LSTVAGLASAEVVRSARGERARVARRGRFGAGRLDLPVP
jgi:hypothetical protein